MELQELITKIKQWAEDRNLIEGSTPKEQMLKLMEEFGELCGGIAKNKPDVIKDSIGDCMVVLIIMNLQFNGMINIPSVLGRVCSDLNRFEITKEEEINAILLAVATNAGHLSHSIAMMKEQDSISNLFLVITTLFLLSTKLYIDISECVQYAYDQIKDRKGKMIDGVFVKEEDL